MGFAISWLAVSGKDSARVLEELALSRTGESEELPEAAVVCASLPRGWFLVFYNTFDSPLASETKLKNLSVGCNVISCQVEEHVMFSSATCHANGVRIWHVEHDAQEGMYNLSTIGNLPPEFGDISAALKMKQDAAGGDAADVNYIHDVPVALAKALTSFRHDEDIDGAVAEPFEILQQGRPTTMQKAWWRVSYARLTIHSTRCRFAARVNSGVRRHSQFADYETSSSTRGFL